MEGALHVGQALGSGEAYLWRRGADAREMCSVEGEGKGVAQLLGQERCLVVAALAGAARVQRHGHEQAGGRRFAAPSFEKDGGEGPGQHALATVLESVDRCAQGPSVPGGRTQAVEGLRVTPPARAVRSVGGGLAADGADRRNNPFHLGKALRAEPVTAPPAAPTTGREEEVEEASERR